MINQAVKPKRFTCLVSQTVRIHCSLQFVGPTLYPLQENEILLQFDQFKMHSNFTFDAFKLNCTKFDTWNSILVHFDWIPLRSQTCGKGDLMIILYFKLSKIQIFYNNFSHERPLWKNNCSDHVKLDFCWHANQGRK